MLEVRVVNNIMQWLSSTVKVTGEGMVTWKLRDDCGVEHTIKVNALMVLTSKVRLFSLQSYFAQEQGG